MRLGGGNGGRRFPLSNYYTNGDIHHGGYYENSPLGELVRLIGRVGAPVEIHHRLDLNTVNTVYLIDGEIWVTDEDWWKL